MNNRIWFQNYLFNRKKYNNALQQIIYEVFTISSSWWYPNDEAGTKQLSSTRYCLPGVLGQIHHSHGQYPLHDDLVIDIYCLWRCLFLELYLYLWFLVACINKVIVWIKECLPINIQKFISYHSKCSLYWSSSWWSPQHSRECDNFSSSPKAWYFWRPTCE